MLRKALVFIILVSMLATTVSAVHFGDTRIMGDNSKPLNDLYVDSGKKIDVTARLEEYRQMLIFVYYVKDWYSCTLRDVDLGVFDSSGKMVHSDKVRTGFFSATAHFDAFALKDPGDYTCYIKYAGKLKNCQTQFKIHVS